MFSYFECINHMYMLFSKHQLYCVEIHAIFFHLNNDDLVKNDRLAPDGNITTYQNIARLKNAKKGSPTSISTFQRTPSSPTKKAESNQKKQAPKLGVNRNAITPALDMSRL